MLAPRHPWALDLSCCLRTTLAKVPADGLGTIREAMSTIESEMAGPDLTRRALELVRQRFWFEPGWKWFDEQQQSALTRTGNGLCATLREDLRAGVAKILAIRPEVPLASIIARFSHRERGIVWSGAISEFFDLDVEDESDYMDLLDRCESYREGCPEMASNAELGAALFQLNRVFLGRGPCHLGSDCPNTRILRDAVQLLLQSERMAPQPGREIVPQPLKRRFGAQVEEYFLGLAVMPRATEPADGGYTFASVSFPRVRAIAHVARAVRHPSLPILLLGKPGTGKEVLARLAHALSARRRDADFVSLNCAAVPEALLEAELFGHEPGAFSGAHGAAKGKFRSADGGTLFFDEIGEMPITAQAKLLRVLETREVEALGADSKSVRVDVRVVAATNRDLEAAAVRGEFRRDLFDRLRGEVVHLPPLRLGDPDVPIMASSFLSQTAKEQNREFRWADDAVPTLMTMEWPGNVRDLRNLVARATTRARHDVVDGGALRGAYAGASSAAPLRERPSTITAPVHGADEGPAPPVGPPTQSTPMVIPPRQAMRAYFEASDSELGKPDYFSTLQDRFKIEVVCALARKGRERRTVGAIARLLGVQQTPLTRFLERHGRIDRLGARLYVKE